MSRYNPKTHCHPYLANWLVILLRFMRHYSNHAGPEIDGRTPKNSSGELRNPNLTASSPRCEYPEFQRWADIMISDSLYIDASYDSAAIPTTMYSERAIGKRFSVRRL